MLGNIRGRADNFGLADVVVLEEDDLEQVTNICVIVHNRSNRVDQVNNLLGHPVTRSSLSTKDGDTGLLLLSLLERHGLEAEIAVNDTKDVELLSLVLVNTLDLDVKESSGVDSDTSGCLDVFGEADLVGIFDLSPLLAEFLVSGERFELVQLGEIGEKTISTALGADQLRQTRVGLVQPTSGGNTVGDVGELVGAIDLDKVLEDGRLDEIRVQLGDSVHLVGSDNGKVCHSDHLGLRLLDNGDPSKDISIVGEVLLNKLQEIQVDVEDDLKMSGQEVLNKTNGPLLQSFREHGVVGVAKLLHVSI